MTTLKVGAGPTGLVLALSLLQNGTKVRVIEKNAPIYIGQRGSGIMVRIHATPNTSEFMRGSIASNPGAVSFVGRSSRYPRRRAPIPPYQDVQSGVRSFWSPWHHYHVSKAGPDSRLSIRESFFKSEKNRDSVDLNSSTPSVLVKVGCNKFSVTILRSMEAKLNIIRS